MKKKPLHLMLMRITFIQIASLLFLIGNAVAKEGKAQAVLDQEISLNIQNEKLSNVLTLIEKQTDVKFVYSSAIIVSDRKVTVTANKKTIAAVLDQLLPSLQLKYEVSGQAILIKRARADKKSGISAVQQSQIQVSGKVTDEKGEPLIGVSVKEMGTTNGASTDTEGNYRISVSNSDVVLVYSYLGYVTKELPVNGRNVLNVVLNQDVQSLDEVVVVGYGTQRKRDLTGAVSSISQKELEAIPATSFDQYLQGRAAGVQVTQSSSAPGGALNVRIRGGSSLTAGIEPLYVVDGFPIYNNNSDYTGRRPTQAGQAPNALSVINPNDIESIEILKDASATAIYGARGANGVVLITTKRGKAGQNRIDLESYYGVQSVQRKIELLNSREYAQLINEVRLNDNPSNAPAFNPDTITTNTDWQDLLFRAAPMQNHQLTFSGGESRTRYLISGNFFQQDGVVRGSDYTRFAIRANIDKTYNEKFSIGNNLTVSRSINNQVISDIAGATSRGAGVSNAQRMAPFIPAFDVFGNYNNNDYRNYVSVNGNLDNPLYLAEAITNATYSNRILGNLFATYNIFKDLAFRTTIGADVASSKDNYFTPANFNRNPLSNNATVNAISNVQWINENQLTYARTFGEKHNLNATSVFSIQKQRREFVGAQTFDVPSNEIGLHDLNAGQTNSAQNRTFSNASEWSMISFTNRVNYNYESKYYLTASIRWDGSSRFGNNNKHSSFPSLAAAWTLSEESFMKDLPVISNLKIRGSIGRTGNAEIPSYQSIGVLDTEQYIFNDVVYTGYSPDRLPNPRLQWETTTQTDAGLDLGLFQNRVSLSADWFNKKTTDMLYRVNVPYTSGFSNYITNIGSLRNYGIELSLNTVNLNGAFQWSTSLNFSRIRNKVLELGVADEIINGTNILREGEPVGLFYGYRTNGIFQNQAEIDNSAQTTGSLKAKPGDIRYVDINGDNTINASDRVIIGGGMPDFFGGMTNTFSYKGFDMSVFINAVIGYDVYNQNKTQILNLNGQFNQMKEAANRWTPQNPSNSVPRATSSGGSVNNQVSDRFVEDGSFVRLRNVTLGYTLPGALLPKTRMKNLRLYITGQNLFTITDYSGYDPEVSSFGNNQTNFSTDRGAYPSSRTLLFGLSLGL